MRFGLRGKLILPIIGVVAVCLTAIVGLVFYQAQKSIREEVFAGLINQTEETAHHIDEWLESRAVDLTDWTYNGVHLRALDGEATALESSSLRWEDKVKVYGFYESLFLMNPEGKIVSGSNSKIIGLDMKDRAYFGEAISGKTAFSPVILSKATQKPIFVVAVPIKDSAGQIKGVLGAAIQLQHLQALFLDGMKAGQTGYAFMVSAQGLGLVHPNPKLLMNDTLGRTSFGQEMVRQREGALTYEWDGQDKELAFHQVPLTGWIVAVTVPLREILGGLAAVTRYAGLGGLISLVLAAVSIWFVVGRITGVMGKAVKHLGEVAQGDLSLEVDPRHLASKDEIGDLARAVQALVTAQREKAKLAETIAQGDLTHEVTLASDKDGLGHSLDHMTKNLAGLVGRVSQASFQVAGGAEQITASSQALSQGATEQAASLEEISASLLEVGGQTGTNADNARQAELLVGSARKAADKGDQEMRQMVEAMNGIKDSAQEIAKIIKVIDDIAFQTNLLALNAAVEAARAGSHGKGFAVVAEEVRNLAARSAKAARETAEMIEESMHRAEEGAETAGRTAASLENISREITKVDGLVAEIAAASREQAEAVSQLNQGLSQIDMVTQANTASAEETAAAAESLNGQAKLLQDILQQFHVGGNGNGNGNGHGRRRTDSGYLSGEGDLRRLPGA
ncbi:MAG: methyl-accepting chemotaxis protein [Deltaproteobacteria bacterium]|nr:methyl-accepting chemotaxis protein [Deltaproteobacteria bacterium]